MHSHWTSAGRIACTNLKSAIGAAAVLTMTGLVHAQQVADTSFKPPIERPTHAAGSGPTFTPRRDANSFADLLRRDGYTVWPSPDDRLNVPATRDSWTLCATSTVDVAPFIAVANDSGPVSFGSVQRECQLDGGYAAYCIADARYAFKVSEADCSGKSAPVRSVAYLTRQDATDFSRLPRGRESITRDRASTRRRCRTP